MKKILIVLIALSTILVSMTILIDLYTKDQIEHLIEKICDNYNPYVELWEYNDQTEKWELVRAKNPKERYRKDVVRTISLCDLLRYNRKSLGPYSQARIFSEDYINWQSVIANNPSLAYTALDLYGDLIIRQIGSRLDYFADIRSVNSGWDYSDSYTKKKFWDANTKSIQQYQKLIDELLKLNDKDLNYFIITNDISIAASYEFNTWLKKKDLLNIDNMSEAGPQSAWNEERYPGDLLCLTKRVYERHPQWTPRKFLTEAKKFSNEVLEIIEDNN